MENQLQISYSPVAMPKTRRIKESQNAEKKSVLEAENSPSVRALRNLFSCRSYHKDNVEKRRKKKSRRAQIGCSGSLCSLGEHPEATTTTTVTGNEARVSTSGGKTQQLKEINGVVPASSSSSLSSSTLTVSSSASSLSASSSVGGSFRVMHLRRLSGCYECHHMAIDPVRGVSREPSLRSTLCPCPDCGEMFVKAESLELHQAIRHAVSELGQEDTSRNIVEIIFQSSWLLKQAPVCKIERILKVHNTKKTVACFEDYRNSVKSKAGKLPKKHPRCVADGNELLRFYCTSFKCSLGLNGRTNLCDSIPHCKVCSIIRDGIRGAERIQTMATSGRAHDAVQLVKSESEKRAMLVCRVIAGRVKKSQDAPEDDQFDSVAGTTGVYSNLDDLYVFNPKSILPCFVVIYRDI